MQLTGILLVVFIAGAIGGLINALMSDNGFMLPRPELVQHEKIFKPGFLGNMLIGGIAAVISWGLYGPFAAVNIIGNNPNIIAASIGISLSALVGAILVGVGGARWLTNEVDKTLLRAAASEAAAGEANVQSALAISIANPSEALRIAVSGTPK